QQLSLLICGFQFLANMSTELTDFVTARKNAFIVYRELLSRGTDLQQIGLCGLKTADHARKFGSRAIDGSLRLTALADHAFCTLGGLTDNLNHILQKIADFIRRTTHL